jgi:NADH-quinone oxidoreductase subunit J
VFATFALLTLAGALLMLLQRNVIIAGLCMVLAFLGVSGLFILLANPVAAALQIIVYAGAIMVLVLFVIMLLNHHEEEPAEASRPIQRWASVALAAVFGFGALKLVLGSTGLIKLGAGQPAPAMTLQALGAAMFSGQVLALEAIGLLLLAAMVGAIALVKKNL